LHMAQLIPLPLTVSCSRKSRLVLVLPFWFQLTQFQTKSRGLTEWHMVSKNPAVKLKQNYKSYKI